MDRPTLASALMGVEDDPIAKRGTFLPFVERKSGKAEIGLPSFLKEPWDALQRLNAGGYQPGTGDEQGVKDSTTLAGALMMGGLGLNWAGQVPKGVLGSSGGQAPTQGIRAYHGSPHDFDKFDSTKIGTGEGAQAYGHGLYFAENEGVARNYKQQLGDVSVGGKAFDQTNGQHWAAEYLEYAKGDREGALKALDTDIRRADAGINDYGPALKQARDMLARGEEIPPKEVSGRMYEVRINADPDQFLDWDKWVSGQRHVMDALGKGGLRPSGDTMTGQDFFRSINSDTRTLQNAGIPGIKYLDQGSRAGGEGTRNYVVFDADKIEILKKYGWVPAGMVGGGMMMTPPDGQEGF